MFQDRPEKEKIPCAACDGKGWTKRETSDGSYTAICLACTPPRPN